MNNLSTWLIYLLIVVVLAILAFGISDKSKGFLKAIQAVSNVLLVLVGITFVVMTVAFAVDFLFPNTGSNSGGSNYSDEQEQCVPDPFGGC